VNQLSYSKTTKIIVAVIVVVIVVAGASVAFYETQAHKTSSKYILIGMPLPLNSPIGTNMLDSAQLAVNQINSHGGVLVNGTHYQLKIITYDTEEADPSIPVSNGINGVTSLITQNHVNYLIGGYRSDVVDAELPIAAQYHTLYITFGADPEISTFVAENYSANKYIFNGFVNSTNQGVQYGALPVYMLLAYKEGLIPDNITNFAILGEQAAWTKVDIGNGGTSSPLYKPFEEVGFNVTYINYFPLSPPGGSYDSLFSQLASLNTQAIYILAAGTETPLLVSNWNTFDWSADKATGGTKPILMGADVMSEMEGKTYDYYNATNGGSNGEFTFGWGPMLPVNITSSSIPFYNEFVANYSFNPIFEDGFVYSSIYYLTEAIQKAQNLSSNAVIPYLEQTNYTGPAGIIKFSPSHGLIITLTPVPSVPAVAMQWHNNGKLYVVWTSLNPLTFTNVQLQNGTVISNVTVKV
jgi:ABC-type branched-subunit amino acid transport system substrate-binding protein